MAVHDFTAPDGSPVRAETGVGVITGLDVKEGRRNIQVRIDADHLRQPVTGWVDTQGPYWDLVKWAHEARARVWYRVDLHRHRKATEPVTTPLGDLPNASKVRDLTRVEVPANAPTVIGLDPHASTPTLNPTPRVAETPGGGPVSSVAGPPATATDGHRPQGTDSPPPGPPGSAAGNPSPRPQSAPGVPGPLLSMDALDALHDVVQAVHGRADEAFVNGACNDAVAAGATVEQVRHVLDRARRGLDVGLMPRRPATTPAPTDEGARRDAARAALGRQRDPDGLTRPVVPADVSTPGQDPADPGVNLVGAVNGMSRRPVVRNVTADARPWDFTNMDGSINYGSYAAKAVGSMVTLASAQRMTRNRSLNHQDPDRYPLVMPTPYEVDSLARTLLTIADRIQVHLRGGGRPDRAGGSHEQARFALKEAIAVMPIPWGNTAAMTRWVEEVELYGRTLCDVIAGIVRKEDPLPRDGDTPSTRAEVPPGGPVNR